MTETPPSPWRASRRVLPGIALAVGVAIVARLASQLTPPFIGEVPIAVGLGLLVGNTGSLGSLVAPGISHVVRRWLRVGIVLLGAQLSFALVLGLGLASLGLVLTLVLGTLVLVAIIARVLAVDARVALLIGVGTAICGNTAILAVAPLIGARERQVSFAIATITLFGTAAVLVYPAIGGALGLDQSTFGLWAGTAVSDTSQVVATGYAYGQHAGEVATVVKLTRNLMLAPVLFAIAVWWSQRPATDAQTSGTDGPGMLVATDTAATETRNLPARPRYADAVPLFVLGFMAMAGLNTLGLLDTSVFGRAIAAWSGDAARLLILVALSGVGLSTRFRSFREVGPKPLLVGLAAASALATVSLVLVTRLGLAGA